LYGLYSACFKVACCAILVLAPLLAVAGDLSFMKMLIAVIATFTLYAPMELMGSMTSMIRLMEVSLDRVERVKNVALMDEATEHRALGGYDITFENVGFSYDDVESGAKRGAGHGAEHDAGHDVEQALKWRKIETSQLVSCCV
jgi:ABC-type multidrug transport system fused ATPase/permease subunit